ncbi:hypothetical protein IW261DRAFT_1572715 [Armillaria novae-zelandiae]|uniref:Uncharacterized protein n=1 Tax=Armillaria novae-zelandiae TaxID=153914 RepID=A0AA39NRW4_9AGAR|nr:hypothetical protein IW261DRAFT_1572715 [Armillaria novae-zelandiae]
MSSHMPMLHQGASNYVESNGTPFSEYHSRIAESIPRTANQARLVDDPASFPITPTDPWSSVHPSYRETRLMRPFAPCGLSWSPPGDNDMKDTAAKLVSL